MEEPSLLSVDVVIPVYNSPDIVKRCIDSVIAHLNQSIHTVWIQDDASSVETREMLDGLTYTQVHVHHALRNLGYGQSVNEAVSRSDADLALVLNSDTELRENFLPTLCNALQQDEKLAEVPWVWQILLKGFVRLNNLNYKNGQVDLNFYVSNDRHSLFCSDSVSNFLL